LSFGLFGASFTTFPGGAYASGGWFSEPTLQPDGKLLVAASRYTTATNTDFGVIRLMPNGSVDTGFGSGGAATFAFDRAGSGTKDTASGMALQPADGKILVGGFVDGDTSTGADMAVVRFTAAGAVDLTFGVAGRAIVPFNLGNCLTVANACDDRANRIDMQADGKVLLVGSANTSQTSAVMAIARLTTSGSRDSAFDVDGRVSITFGGPSAAGYRARQLADGQHVVVVGGATTASNSTNFDFALARLDDNGALDSGFGVGGKVTYGFDIGGNMADIAADFIEQPDGKLFVCGEVQVNSPNNYDFACMRFLVDGTPDPAFAPVLVPFDLGGSFFDGALAMRSDNQGRFVLAGTALRADSNSDFAVARLTAAGVLDTSFGQNGTTTIGSVIFGTDRDNAATGVTIQPDGKIVVAGYANIDAAGNEQFQVMRLIGDTLFADDFEE
jgi:uncharacterized delta-60 repeat protein